jgi:adenylate kinase family enzyme
VTSEPPFLPICLIGPPAAGKTTLAEALAETLGAPVVRPRDLVDAAVRRYPATADLFHRDQSGMVADESLGFALRVCLDQLDGLVILENLPWDVVQLADLYRVAGRSVQILTLDGPDELLFRRRTGRLHCPACYPRPVVNNAENRCRSCGTRLTTRADDELGAFAERVQHRRANTSKILGLLLRCTSAWSRWRPGTLRL